MDSLAFQEYKSVPGNAKEYPSTLLLGGRVNLCLLELLIHADIPVRYTSWSIGTRW